MDLLGLSLIGTPVAWLVTAGLIYSLKDPEYRLVTGVLGCATTLILSITFTVSIHNYNRDWGSENALLDIWEIILLICLANIALITIVRVRLKNRRHR